MKVELVGYPQEDDLIWCKECAIGTEGKTLKTPPDEKWLRRIAIAQHSPIRELVYRFVLTDVPYWVLMELCRHHQGCEKYVQSSRNDRQSDFDRNAARQDMPRTMRFSVNLDALINISKKRLCGMATNEMQNLVGLMCREVMRVQPWTRGLFMPACGWQGGECHEMRGCGRNAMYRDV